MQKLKSGWAIKHWNDGIYIDTVRQTRGEAIAIFKALFYRDSVAEAAWKKDRASGVHKPVRVYVVPVSARITLAEGRR